jgi:hypothetical protein
MVRKPPLLALSVALAALVEIRASTFIATRMVVGLSILPADGWTDVVDQSLSSNSVFLISGRSQSDAFGNETDAHLFAGIEGVGTKRPMPRSEKVGRA